GKRHDRRAADGRGAVPGGRPVLRILGRRRRERPAVVSHCGGDVPVIWWTRVWLAWILLGNWYTRYFGRRCPCGRRWKAGSALTLLCTCGRTLVMQQGMRIDVQKR